MQAFFKVIHFSVAIFTTMLSKNKKIMAEQKSTLQASNSNNKGEGYLQ